MAPDYAISTYVSAAQTVSAPLKSMRCTEEFEHVNAKDSWRHQQVYLQGEA